MADRDFSAIGWQYAEQIVGRDIPAGQWAIKAAQRALDDRKHLAGYRYDQGKGNRVCAFVERLTHVKGRLGGTLIRLEPWQCFVLCQAFGWLHDGGDRDGLRRFRTVYIEVPRGNGKSCLSSAVALYCLAADGEYGAEVYSSATTADQARIVFNDAKAMTKASASAKLMAALGVEPHAHTITVETKNSTFKATSAEYSNMDGMNVSCAVIDELHAHDERGLWDVITTGAGKRPQSIIWAITTAGSDRAGICYEQRTYLTKLLDRVATDESMFGCIWCADDGDDWQAEAVWSKANPNWKVSVEPSYIAALCRKAQAMPAAQNSFKTKHLCQWVSADQAWMDMRAWDRCRDPTMQIEEFATDPCYVGLDLATKTDIAAKMRLFTRAIGGQTHYFAFGEYYLPESAVSDGRNSQYPGWQSTGQLIVTPGDVTDFDLIEDFLEEDGKRFDVREVAYDSWQASQLAQHMMEAGVPMVEYRKIVANYSEPMKELDAIVRSGRFHHNDPILTWMASNVVAHTDQKGNIFPRKERPENKIDGIDALISALGRAMMHQADDGGPLIFLV